MADVQPINQAAILAGGQSLVPDFLNQEIERSLGRAQVDQTQAQTGLIKQKLMEGLAGVQRQQQYDNDVRMALESGDARSLSELIVKYPEQKDALKASWDQMDSLKQRSELRQAAGIWSALNAGNTDVAIRQLEQRITSDREAGEDTADDEEQLALLKSGDPKAVNSVKGRLGLFMASVVPEKFASVVEQLGTGAEGYTLSPGQRRFDAEGNVIAEAPFAPRPVTVGEGQTVIEYDPSGAGGSIVDQMIPITLQSESGNRDFAGNGSILTSSAGAQGRMQVMPGTQSDPGFGITPARDNSMEEKARVGRDYLNVMMQRYGNDPAKAWAAYNAGPGAVDAAISSGGDWLSKLPAETRAYVNKNVSALGGGGPRVIARGAPKAPKEQYRILSPQEVSAQGLDPALRYQMSPDGQITLVGGQDTRTRQGRAIPDSTAKRVETNIGIRDGLTRAVSGFKPDYAGNTVTGGLENILQGTLGTGTPGQRDWWANFRSLDNQIRNDLFGAALTASEQKAYEETTISERMKPTEVRRNLQRRLDIVKKALARQQNFLKKNGYAEEAVDALYATDALDGGGPVSVRSVQEASALPPGTLYRAPDGKVRRR